jgi:tripartite-type tricarboxylate transporter receptor subunit TctC
MRPMLVGLVTLIAGCSTLFSPNTAKTQGYPAHPVRIIVSSAAGGPLDVVARAFAEKLADSLKQPVVVESRSGAGGNIAADFVSKSEPDGYTLLFTLSSTLTVNPHIYKGLNFNLKPITVVNYSTQTLFVHPSVPVSNVDRICRLGEERGPDRVCAWR